jgi:hypothetical protein
MDKMQVASVAELVHIADRLGAAAPPEMQLGR